ncbi:DNA polymerase III subunit gamma/tau [Pararobbsia silviterrae]|uniref:DNA-directed DNA polymerase n=1 Tax=Pararobbsia silviterrae TaxID=1792498 RepID=A0A494XZW1_9BURK|nr:DNA polymerase III subunit gamma/tau [Pararobbsia silviterrae]RKP54589.1 DNA polymerase III subunit gamma/tau [Pararobbsia silviterrae]
MTYQVLARKWRPKDFASLVGQDHVVRALTHALDSQRLHHAYLFTGTRGIGKTTLSRILAKALNCETGVTATPCGVCSACRAIDEGRFVDYVEMDAASNRGVEEMASLLERAIYAPVDARFKVYMIDEVHMLTNHAFNAMLKTLEEPPAHVKFILATTDPQKIPVTVLSRCLQFNLKQMPATHIVGHLENILSAEHIGYDAQALRLLAKAADGSMRDALSLTDQAIAYSAGVVGEEAVRGMLGALDQSYLIRLLDAIVEGEGTTVLAIADEMASRSLSFSTALADLAGLLHRIAWAQVAPASVLDEWPEAGDVRRFASALGAEQVQLLYQIATIGRAELGLAPDEYAGFSMTLLRMLAFRPLGDRLGGLPPSGGASTGGASSVPSAGSGGMGRAGAGAARAALASSGSADASQGAAPSSKRAADLRESASGAAAVAVGSAERAPLRERGDAVGDRRPPEAVHPAAADTRERSPVHAQESVQAWAHESTHHESAQGLEHGAEQASDRATQAVASADRGDTAAPSVDASDASAASDTSRESRESNAPRTASAPPSAEQAEPAVADTRPVSPARAALEALRLAGLRVPTDKSRASAPVAPRRPASSAPSAPVTVPTPRRPASPAGADRSMSTERPRGTAEQGEPALAQHASAARAVDTPPWEALPDAAYEGGYATDDDFYGGEYRDAGDAGDTGYTGDARASAMPSDDLDSMRGASMRSAPNAGVGARADAGVAPVTEVVPKEPPVRLTEFGHDLDWPAFVTRLALRGFARELAFRSELSAIRGTTLELRVAVPQLGDRAHVDKLKAELDTQLGRAVELSIVNGAVHYTAAAIDDASRARRQLDAERAIERDPFVQTLIRDFGASIIPGSIRPVPSGAGPAPTA